MRLFTCKACQSKDGEIQFLRALLSNVRSIVRDPEFSPGPVNYQGQGKTEIREVAIPILTQPFNRNPVEVYEEPTEARDGRVQYKTEDE